jgi:hypothetical protein
VGEDNTKRNTNRFAIILLVIGIFTLIVSGIFLGRQLALDIFGVKTTGTVTGMRGSNTRSPVIEFTTADGEQIVFRSWHATNFIVYDSGDKVDIAYLELYPRIAEVRLLAFINYPDDIGWFCLGSFLTVAGLIAVRNKPITIDLRRKSK